MTTQDLEKLIQYIVRRSCDLKDKHTMADNAPVNYACIFSQSGKEYDELYLVTK